MLTREPQIEIQNVVASGNLNQNLDLYAILKANPAANYNPQTFPGLLYRLKRPRTSTLLFASGRMICTGGKSERSAKNALNRLVNELQTHGIVIARKPRVEIVNIVASANLGGTIDLELVAQQLTPTMYEPEQFPGLIYRMVEPKTVILIFTSGRLVITGARRETDVKSAVKKLQETLEKDQLISYNESSHIDRVSLPTIAPVESII